MVQFIGCFAPVPNPFAQTIVINKRKYFTTRFSMLLLVFIFQATREEKKSTHQNENELRDGRKNTEPK